MLRSASIRADGTPFLVNSDGATFTFHYGMKLWAKVSGIYHYDLHYKNENSKTVSEFINTFGVMGKSKKMLEKAEVSVYCKYRTP